MDWNVVHVRVNDAATGKPTPVRVRFTTPDGTYLPPLGRLETAGSQVAPGNVVEQGKLWAYVEGSFEIRLPAGPLHVDITKGPEFAPVRQTVVRKMGQMALRFVIERQTNLASDGWLAGDVAAYGLSPAAAALEGAAEGLDYVNVLAEEKENGEFPGLLDFSGQLPALSRDGCDVVVNTLNDGDSAGQLLLLNSHRVIYPLRFGKTGFEKFTLADWCQQCHRKAGLVVRPWEQPLPVDDDTWLQIDAIAWTPHVANVRECLERWYALLNHGRRMALVGGSGKRDTATALGSVRTYCNVSADIVKSYACWIEAIRLGRVVATRGPVVSVECGGKKMGGVLRRDDVFARTSIHLSAAAVPSGMQIELVVDGVVRGNFLTEQPGALEKTLPLPAVKQWVAIRGWLAEELVFHGSPIYLSAPRVAG